MNEMGNKEFLGAYVHTPGRSSPEPFLASEGWKIWSYNESMIALVHSDNKIIKEFVRVPFYIRWSLG